jgi:hypothetical protein
MNNSHGSPTYPEYRLSARGKVCYNVYPRESTKDESTPPKNEGENVRDQQKGIGVKNNSSLADSKPYLSSNGQTRAANKRIQAMSEYTTTPNLVREAVSFKVYNDLVSME